MVKKMLINASHPEECRVAVVADGVLEELDVQIKAREATLGNIYKAVITRIEPSLQAVFVDYGAQKNGFLSINDIHPSYFPESVEAGRKRARIQDVFKKDDVVIVQVNKEERYTKGASLTTNISLAGRYLVLMPGTDLCGVSRKIEDDKERKKLKEIVKQLSPPENMGFIIRTAGMGRSKTELARDLAYLLKLWQSIEKNVADDPAPALLYREHDIVIRSIREHFSSDISEILVDDKDVYNKARDFFEQVMPKYENLVKLSQDKRPLFNKYQLEEQIEQVHRKRIKLKSGGYIIIEPTEALVTIDVNSGSSTKEKSIEDTAFRVNMEAAPEIARQLRLRDLGGIIVIDFIDMIHKNHKQEVERAIKTEFKKDRAKSKISRISSLGLLELSRQRLKSSLGTGEYLACPLCDGHGKIRSPEMAALSIFRRVKSHLIKGDVTEVRATVPERVAEYLLNNMRSQLVEIEKVYASRIVINSKPNMPDSEIIIEAVRDEVHREDALRDRPTARPGAREIPARESSARPNRAARDMIPAEATRSEVFPPTGPSREYERVETPRAERGPVMRVDVEGPPAEPLVAEPLLEESFTQAVDVEQSVSVEAPSLESPDLVSELAASPQEVVGTVGATQDAEESEAEAPVAPEVVADEDSEATEVKKAAKQPRRRRRGGRKKAAPEAEEQVAETSVDTAAEAPPAVLDEADEAIAAAAPRLEEDLLEVLLGIDPAPPATAPKRETASSKKGGAAEAKPQESEQVTAPEESSAAPETEESAAAPAEGAQEESEPEEPAPTKGAKRAPRGDKGKRRKKTTLENYLPFS